MIIINVLERFYHYKLSHYNFFTGGRGAIFTKNKLKSESQKKFSYIGYPSWLNQNIFLYIVHGKLIPMV